MLEVTRVLASSRKMEQSEPYTLYLDQKPKQGGKFCWNVSRKVPQWEAQSVTQNTLFERRKWKRYA
jgi:hypothetical protein